MKWFELWPGCRGQTQKNGHRLVIKNQDADLEMLLGATLPTRSAMKKRSPWRLKALAAVLVLIWMGSMEARQVCYRVDQLERDRQREVIEEEIRQELKMTRDELMEKRLKELQP